MNKSALVIVGLFGGLMVVAAWAGPMGAMPLAPAARIEFVDVVPLEIDYDEEMAVSLSPDGKTLLFIEETKAGKPVYTTIGTDGKNKRAVFESAVTEDEVLGFCLGHGTWSPDGARFAAATAEKDDDEKFRAVVCDAKTGQATRLPCRIDITLAALFDAAGSVYYSDFINPDKPGVWRTSVRKHDLKTGQSVEAVGEPNGVILGLAMSPQRRRLGGLLVRVQAGEDREPEFRLWALDLRTGKTAESPALYLDPEMGLVRWDTAGEELFANAAETERDEEEFSIVRFTPFPAGGAKPGLRWLQAKKAMHIGAAIFPGKFSAAPEDQKNDEKQAFVLDVNTDTLVKANLPLLLLDRRGDVGVFVDLRTDKLCIARIVGVKD